MRGQLWEDAILGLQKRLQRLQRNRHRGLDACEPRSYVLDIDYSAILPVGLDQVSPGLTDLEVPYWTARGIQTEAYALPVPNASRDTALMTANGVWLQELAKFDPSLSQGPSDGVARGAAIAPSSVLVGLGMSRRDPTDITIPVLAGSEASSGGDGGDAIIAGGSGAAASPGGGGALSGSPASSSGSSTSGGSGGVSSASGAADGSGSNSSGGPGGTSSDSTLGGSSSAASGAGGSQGDGTVEPVDDPSAEGSHEVAPDDEDPIVGADDHGGMGASWDDVVNEGQATSGSTVWIRVEGGLQALGGLVGTLVAGGVAIFDPEPITKIGAVAVAGVALDNYTVGMDKLIYAKRRQTVTTQVVSQAAQAINVSPQYADAFGQGVNDGVMMFGVPNAARSLQSAKAGRLAAVGTEGAEAGTAAAQGTAEGTAPAATSAFSDSGFTTEVNPGRGVTGFNTTFEGPANSGFLQSTYTAKTGDLYIDVMRSQVQREGLGEAMLRKTIQEVEASAGEVKTISGNLENVNRAQFLQGGLESTPAYKLRRELGFTEVVVSPSESNGYLLVTRKPG